MSRPATPRGTWRSGTSISRSTGRCR